MQYVCAHISFLNCVYCTEGKFLSGSDGKLQIRVKPSGVTVIVNE